jgi:hypothetical protein
MTGDRDRAEGSRIPGPETNGRLTTTAPVRPLAPAPTVYDDVRRVLLEHGWARGREHDGRGGLGLAAAVETAVRSAARPDVILVPAEGPRLAREARIVRHLKELAGASNLGAWSDAPERDFGDVLELLSLAATLYPED